MLLTSDGRSNSPQWVAISIPASAGFFIFALFVSAAFQPSLRWLHGLQALIYVAIIFLSRQNSAWGFGAGVFIGAFWNFIFLRGASRDIWALLSGAHFGPTWGNRLNCLQKAAGQRKKTGSHRPRSQFDPFSPFATGIMRDANLGEVGFYNSLLREIQFAPERVVPIVPTSLRRGSSALE